MNERPAGDDEPAIALSATEEHLLAYIRAGVVDAEIAALMGLSNGDVKARVERLAAKLTAGLPLELREPLPQPFDLGLVLR
jgi:DNA-binding NarL/FixJ family response regulator